MESRAMGGVQIELWRVCGQVIHSILRDDEGYGSGQGNNTTTTASKYNADSKMRTRTRSNHHQNKDKAYGVKQHNILTQNIWGPSSKRLSRKVPGKKKQTSFKLNEWSREGGMSTTRDREWPSMTLPQKQEQEQNKKTSTKSKNEVVVDTYSYYK